MFAIIWFKFYSFHICTYSMRFEYKDTYKTETGGISLIILSLVIIFGRKWVWKKSNDARKTWMTKNDITPFWNDKNTFCISLKFNWKWKTFFFLLKTRAIWKSENGKKYIHIGSMHSLLHFLRMNTWALNTDNENEADARSSELIVRAIWSAF